MKSQQTRIRKKWSNNAQKELVGKFKTEEQLIKKQEDRDGLKD